ncbi:MAG: OmpA family protein [Myxococcales bacterium]|nr:OmpA family protein [Myxococcota bacterium]MDW8280225.1 OmpA family protein [Myxococcales bacterium]
MKLTITAKVILSLIVVAIAISATRYLSPDLWNRLAPPAQRSVGTNVPPPARLVGETALEAIPESPPGCADLPEVRFYHWAWNAQMGLMLATGGKQATADSLMCKRGVNLRLIREDNVDTMQSLLLTFAEELKRGEAHPKKGAHFVAIMGDGAAAFLKGLNDKLRQLGPEYMAVVIGSCGYSRGEDKFMGPPSWKQNPQSARGGLVAGVLRDGDWNIAMKWLGDNRIPNNPDETSYDPDALNWVNASDYIDAAQKYVSGYCTELRNVKTGQREKRCVDGVVTWTPGDVTVAHNRGGLVSIVSTREYRSQMPNVIIGNKRWMADNAKLVTGMLSAIFDAGDLIKDNDEALKRAAAISALVYNEKDAAYWYKYFRSQVEVDKQGLLVELGGSSVNNLADNLQLFGLAPGSTNAFAVTYTVFAEIVKSQYPDLMPSFYPVEQVQDLRYLKMLAAQGPAGKADLPTFHPQERLGRVVSRRSWDIQFASGSAKFTPAALQTLERLFNDLVVASGTLVEIHGHTDNQGGIERNQLLSEQRAFAVKEWLEKKSPANFPEGRIRVFAHGQTQPVASNATSEGRARNRRVEIVLGTTN